jgi:hypothetical protein
VKHARASEGANASDHFLIEAFSNPASLEVRLINAFVHLETIDESATLSPDSVSNNLGIARGDADAIVKVRNAIIHQGMGLSDALAKAAEHLRERRPDADLAFWNIVNADRSHGHFYTALMDLLSRCLARRIGVPPEWVKRQGRVSLVRSHLS